MAGSGHPLRVSSGRGRLNDMSDTDTDFVTVRLVGGPEDGGTLPVPWDAVYADPEPGFAFVPEDGSGAPDGYTRVLYTFNPGGPPDVWHWRDWSP